ncbi:hypothetical protein [Legionella fairfieldensis]|uniref:hypothetical protein n=1 Tax=Legionella fairfieldensis TaxID=45064 RepID=UPI00048F32A1|nr:hypothetical protein [Legionella fairfieldensis]
MPRNQVSRINNLENVITELRQNYNQSNTNERASFGPLGEVLGKGSVGEICHAYYKKTSFFQRKFFSKLKPFSSLNKKEKENIKNLLESPIIYDNLDQINDAEIINILSLLQLSDGLEALNLLYEYDQLQVAFQPLFEAMIDSPWSFVKSLNEASTKTLTLLQQRNIPLSVENIILILRHEDKEGLFRGLELIHNFFGDREAPFELLFQMISGDPNPRLFARSIIHILSVLGQRNITLSLENINLIQLLSQIIKDDPNPSIFAQSFIRTLFILEQRNIPLSLTNQLLFQIIKNAQHPRFFAQSLMSQLTPDGALVQILSILNQKNILSPKNFIDTLQYPHQENLLDVLNLLHNFCRDMNVQIPFQRLFDLIIDTQEPPASLSQILSILQQNNALSIENLKCVLNHTDKQAVLEKLIQGNTTQNPFELFFKSIISSPMAPRRDEDKKFIENNEALDDYFGLTNHSDSISQNHTQDPFSFPMALLRDEDKKFIGNNEALDDYFGLTNHSDSISQNDTMPEQPEINNNNISTSNSGKKIVHENSTRYNFFHPNISSPSQNNNALVDEDEKMNEKKRIDSL